MFEENEITKKVYNNVMNSVQLEHKMGTTFMNAKNSETYNLQRLLLNLTEKINLRKRDKHVSLSNLDICYKWKNIKKLYKNNNFNISAPMRNEKFELPCESYSVLDI